MTTLTPGDPPPLKPQRSTAWLVVKIILIIAGGFFLLGCVLIGLVLYMCSRH